MSTLAILTSDSADFTFGAGNNDNRSDAWAVSGVNSPSVTRKLGAPSVRTQTTELVVSNAVQRIHMGTWVTPLSPEAIDFKATSTLALHNIRGYQTSAQANTYIWIKVSIVTESGGIYSFNRTLVDWTQLAHELSTNAGSAYPLGGNTYDPFSGVVELLSAETLAINEALAVEVGFDQTANKTSSCALEYGDIPNDHDSLVETGSGAGSFGSGIVLPMNFADDQYQDLFGGHGEIFCPRVAGTDVISWADIGTDWSTAKWVDTGATRHVTRAGGEITCQFWTFQDDDFVYFALNNIIDGCIQASDHHEVFLCPTTDWKNELTTDPHDWLFRRDITAHTSAATGPTHSLVPGDKLDMGNQVWQGDASVTYPHQWELPTYSAGTYTFTSNSKAFVEGVDFRMGGPGATTTAPNPGGSPAGAYSEFKIRKSSINNWNGSDPCGFMMNFQCDVQGNGNIYFPAWLGNQIDKPGWHYCGNYYEVGDNETAAAKTTVDAADLRVLMGMHIHGPTLLTPLEFNATSNTTVTSSESPVKNIVRFETSGTVITSHEPEHDNSISASEWILAMGFEGDGSVAKSVALLLTRSSATAGTFKIQIQGDLGTGEPDGVVHFDSGTLNAVDIPYYGGTSDTTFTWVTVPILPGLELTNGVRYTILLDGTLVTGGTAHFRWARTQAEAPYAGGTFWYFDVGDWWDHAGNYGLFRLYSDYGSTITLDSTEFTVGNKVDIEVSASATVDSSEVSIDNSAIFQATANTTVTTSQATIVGTNNFSTVLDEYKGINTPDIWVPINYYTFEKSGATPSNMYYTIASAVVTGQWYRAVYTINTSNDGHLEMSAGAGDVAIVDSSVGTHISPAFVAGPLNFVGQEVFTDGTWVGSITLHSFFRDDQMATSVVESSEADIAISLDTNFEVSAPANVESAEVVLLAPGEVDFEATADITVTSSEAAISNENSYEATADTSVETTEAAISNENLYEVTSDTTVESAEAVVIVSVQYEFEATSNSAVEATEAVISNENLYEATSATTVESTELAISTTDQADFNVSSNTTVESSEASISNENLYEATASSVVESAEAVVIVSVQYEFEATSNSAVEATEAVISNENLYEATSDTTVTSSELSVSNENLYEATADTSVDSTEASVSNENAYEATADLTANATDFNLYNDHAFYPNADATLDASQASLIITGSTEFAVEINATVESTEAVVTVSVQYEFEAASNTVVETTEAAISNENSYEVTANSIVESAEASVSVEFIFEATADTSVETTEAAISNENSYEVTATSIVESAEASVSVEFIFEATADTSVETTEAAISNENSYEVTSNSIVDSTEVNLYNDHVFYPTADADVDSTQASLVTVGQIDFAVSCDASVAATELAISNENLYEASANSVVEVQEVELSNENAFEATASVLVESTEAVITNENAFPVTAQATVESTETTVENENLLQASANSSVESSQASLVTIGQIDFAVSTNAIVEVEGVFVSNENSYNVSADATVESTEALIDVGNEIEFLISSSAILSASEFDLLVRYMLRNPDGSNGGILQNTDGSHGGVIKRFDGQDWI